MPAGGDGRRGSALHPLHLRLDGNAERRGAQLRGLSRLRLGGILITPLPGGTKLKPGSAALPFFGIQPAIVDADGNLLENEASGSLVMLDAWPGSPVPSMAIISENQEGPSEGNAILAGIDARYVNGTN
jgi:hypothetical protein